MKHRCLRHWLIALGCLLLPFLSTSCYATDNATQARALFNKTWNMVTGPNGFRVNYAVNIVGLYKTSGVVWAKGKKQHYVESRYCGWSDGKHFRRVDTKKRTVDLYDADSPKRDKYLSKFTFSPNDYSYSWQSEKDGIVISLDRRRGSSGVKHAKVVLDRKTLYPKALRIKVAFFWTTVHLSHFQSGGISDNVFAYPAAKYKDYKFTDHRGKD